MTTIGYSPVVYQHNREIWRARTFMSAHRFPDNDLEACKRAAVEWGEMVALARFGSTWKAAGVTVSVAAKTEPDPNQMVLL